MYVLLNEAWSILLNNPEKYILWEKEKMKDLKPRNQLQ